MANRIVGHVIIIDSAMGNNLVLTSANLAINMSGLLVNAIGFFATDTTGAMTLTQTNTATQEIFKTSWVTQGAGTNFNPTMQWYPFPHLQRFINLKVPVLTQATGFIYLV